MSTRKRLLIVLAVTALMVMAFAVPAFAEPFSIAGHDYLYAKTPVEGAAWTITPGGAWGKLNYKLCPRNMFMQGFAFNGHGLEAGVNYSLVNYLGWPNVAVVGTGMADEFGNVHISGKSRLILESDGDPLLDGRAKVWLIPTANLTGNVITIWDVPSMLFEGAGIALR